MARININTGSSPNDGTGDPLRTAFTSTNANFTELYQGGGGTRAAIATSDIDFATAQVFTKTMTADTTFTFSNASIGMVKDLIITGSFVPTFPVGTKVVAGTYDGTVNNFIQVVVTDTAEYWLSISKEQV
jgi:hypothetical protein